jgi:serine protease Do
MMLYPLTTQMATQLGVGATTGAFVNEIEKRSPAYQAGLDAGDVIVSFNGTAVVDPAHFVQLVSDARIGSTATIVVFRDGRQVTLKVPVLQREG